MHGDVLVRARRRLSEVKTRWVVLYYDEKSERRYHTLGLAAEMNKGTADEKRQEFMREINGGVRTTKATRPPTVAEFLDQVYLPFYRGKWKESTAGTSENSLRHHIIKGLGPSCSPQKFRPIP